MSVEINSTNQSNSIQNVSENRQFRFKHRGVEKLASFPKIVLSERPWKPYTGITLSDLKPDLKDPMFWSAAATAIAFAAFIVAGLAIICSAWGLSGAALPIALGALSVALGGFLIGGVIMHVVNSRSLPPSAS